jgi:hypothetical protein
MRWVFIVVGIIMDLMGTVWLLQGLTLLPGTFMRGNPTWVVIGAIMDVIGIGLIVFGARRRRATA